VETTEPQPKQSNEEEMDSSDSNHLSPRYPWLDQLRGVLLIFYTIASLTGLLSANIRGAEVPVGPTWLNFGYKWIDFYPAMITLVDLGFQLFGYILGVSIAISFRQKQVKYGNNLTWITIFNRVFVLIWIGQVFGIDLHLFMLNDIIVLGLWGLFTIIAIFFRNFKFKRSGFRLVIGLLWSISSVIFWVLKFDLGIWMTFFGTGFAQLALATLFAALCIVLIKKPDYRIIIPVILIALQYYLWEQYQEWNIIIFNETSFKTVFMVPFEALGLIIVAITGTCVWDWFKLNPEKPQEGTRKRLIPLMSITYIGQFIIDFFQTGDSRGMNPSVIFLGIALSTAFFMLAHAIGVYYKFNLPIFSYLGKNALFLVSLQGVIMIIYGLIWPGAGQDFRNTVSQWFHVYPTHALVNFAGILVFVIPLALIILIAWTLERMNIHIKAEGILWKK
jgi:hypothetical protein